MGRPSRCLLLAASPLCGYLLWRSTYSIAAPQKRIIRQYRSSAPRSLKGFGEKTFEFAPRSPAPQRSTKNSQLDDARRQKIIAAFVHSWKGYRQYAWGRDEVKPKSSGSNEAWGGFSVTMIDGLDTAMLMGLGSEVEAAIAYLSANFTFAKNHIISVFEMTIRVLGGLLSAYDLSNDERLLKLARHVGETLLPAFHLEGGTGKSTTISGQLHTASGGTRGRAGNLAEKGTLQLEMGRLSQLTPGNEKFARAAESFGDLLLESYLDHPASLNGAFDSFYEYLLKMHLLTAKSHNGLLKAYRTASSGVAKHLYKPCTPSQIQPWPIANARGAFLASSGGRSEWMEHLACFWPGTLALSVLTNVSANPKDDTAMAINLATSCYHAYSDTPTGLAPDAWHFNPSTCTITPSGKKYSLRPETIESLWYLWRLTHNQTYREWGWNIFEALESECRTSIGYAGLLNVYQKGSTEDSEPSFWMAEVLKYLFLLFSDDDVLPLDQWVLNTEAHPFRIDQPEGDSPLQFPECIRRYDMNGVPLASASFKVSKCESSSS